MRRWTIKIILLLAALCVSTCLVCGVFLAEITLHLPRRPLRHQREAAELVQAKFSSSIQSVSITADDGVQLSAWFIVPRNASGNVVILLHGVTDNREGIAGFAPMFLEDGDAVLLPDARAHGESGGSIATYGVKERYDILQWTEWLKKYSNKCVYLFGESMGAAIALQATAVVPRICAVAVESPFSTFHEIAYDRLAGHTPFATWFWRSAGRPLVETAFVYAQLRYGVALTEADTVSAVEHSEVPVLLIAGTADRNIPMRHSVELMRSSASHAELWIVEGADHGGAVSVARPEFQRRILSWFHEHQQSSRLRSVH